MHDLIHVSQYEMVSWFSVPSWTSTKNASAYAAANLARFWLAHVYWTDDMLGISPYFQPRRFDTSSRPRVFKSNAIQYTSCSKIFDEKDLGQGLEISSYGNLRIVNALNIALLFSRWS